jgi:hypothetical protein
VGVTIDAADGRRWKVRRRVAWPRRRRLFDWFDAIGIDVPDFSLVGVIVCLVLTTVFALFIVVLLPLIFFVVEALFVFGLIALSRGVWVVEASTPGPPPETKAWKVKGWTRSRRAVDEVASELRAGVQAAPEEGEPS